MKTIKLLFILISFTIFTSNDVRSQLTISDYFNCSLANTNPNLSDNPLILCQGQSSAFLSKYGNQSFWIPNASNQRILTIRVNLNIMQDLNGNGNFQTNDVESLEQIFNWMANIYQTNDQPSDPINGVQFIPDTYIRFELNDIYFYQEPSLHRSTSDLQLLNHLRSLYPERLNEFNIFFTEPLNIGQTSGYTNYLPSLNNFDLDQCIVTYQKFSVGSSGYWACAGHLAHEMGHVLGLNHTYEQSCCPESCVESIPDYLDDVFGSDGINYDCYHDSGFSCDPYDPNNTCTNNILGGTQNSGYFSPKQIGRMRRSLNTYSTMRYVKCVSSENDLEISSDEVWDFGMRLYSNIRVKSGKSLIIQCKVLMPAAAKIIIEPGGKLIIDGGMLTNACDSAWQGIEVWGNSSAHQYPDANGNYQQGYLELKNGATIENAVTAVALWKPNDWTKTGGIVVAEDAVFRNNTRAVQAPEYRNYVPGNPLTEIDNRSNFKNCAFEITSEYLGEATFYKHIDLSKVKGIKFTGCDFSLSPDASGISEWNQAIASYNAGFSVDAILTSQQLNTTYDSCTFSGFYCGIYASRSESSTKTFSVNRAGFTNNTYGVKTFNINSLVVINSNFKIGYNNSTESLICAGVPAYGIYLDNSNGFAIEENHFTKAANAPSANYYGVFAKNTHSQDIIYKNYFSDLSCGNYAEAINYGYYAYSGLKYYCNSNENNYADFYVQLGNPTSGVQSGQGSTTISAGNTFSNNATWHFYNDGNNLIDYYYVYNSSACNPDVNKLYRVTKHAIYQSNACPSHYGGGSEEEFILSAEQKAEREVLFADALTNYNGVKTLYENLKDGGSTASTLTEIQMAQPQNMWDLRSKLLGDSPHLSEDVLKEVADKTDVFTEAAIFDILAANPDELKKEELIKYLEDKENPLPEYMIEILRQVATGTTYKSVLQQEMAKYEQIKSLAANDMIRSILNDSITDFVQLRNWFDNRGGIESDKAIIASYAEEGNYTAAFSLVNALPSLYNLQDKELQEHTNYMQLLDLERTLAIENRKITGLNNTELAVLNSIADSSDNASGAASKGILETYYGNHFCNCPEIVGETAFKSSYVNPNDVNKIYGIEISVKPNPAKDWAAFDYTLPENVNNATLIITDVFGKTIAHFVLSGIQGQQLWDTRCILAGTYIYTLKVNGSSKTGKIVINK